jgi:hypothetical protein
VDREDLSGIAFCPDPNRLDTPRYESFPIIAVGEIMRTGITMTRFNEISE